MKFTLLSRKEPRQANECKASSWILVGMTVVPSPSKVSMFGYPDEFLKVPICRDLTLRCYALRMLPFCQQFLSGASCGALILVTSFDRLAV